MKKLGIFLILMMIVLTFFWVWSVLDFRQPQKEQPQQKQSTKQSDNQGEVIVEVVPISLQKGSDAKFKVLLDTHTVELDYDLLGSASLKDDLGNNLKPLSWSGGSGGHHLNGELIFPAVSEKAKFVELTITNISGFDRRFKWKLS